MIIGQRATLLEMGAFFFGDHRSDPVIIGPVGRSSVIIGPVGRSSSVIGRWVIGPVGRRMGGRRMGG